MRNHSIQCPVILYKSKKKHAHYKSRYLFSYHIFGKGRVLSDALNALQSKMKHWLKECSKKSIQFNPDFFLWLQFNPLLQEESIPFEFRHQSQLILGQAYVLLFEIQDITFAFLPLIQQKIWIPQLDERGKPEQLRAEITRLLQEIIREYSVDEVRQKEEFIQSICEKKKIYLQEVDLSIPTDLYYNPLVQSSTEHDDFSFIRQATVFHGYQELPKVANNLNQSVKTNWNVYEYEDLVADVQEYMYRPINEPLILIGESKVGKTQIIYQAIKQYMEQYTTLHQDQVELYHYHQVDDAPKKSEQKTVPMTEVWHLDPLKVIAGMSIVGAWENRFKAILNYMQDEEDDNQDERDASQKKLSHHTSSSQKATQKQSYNLSRKILYISNPVALLSVGMSRGSSLNLLTLLQPYVAEKRLQVILEATPQQWNQIKQKKSSFADLFQSIHIPTASLEKSLKIATQVCMDIEQKYYNVFTIKALQRVVMLQQSFFKARALPGTLIDLAKEFAYRYRHQFHLTHTHVLEYFTQRFSIHPHLFDHTQALSHQKLSTFIHTQLIGQSEAVEALIHTIHLIKAGLKPTNKPIQSFLFVGPTGVGKTQAAKVLAHYLFDSEDALIRFDMNEYIDHASALRLIGTPHATDGLLTSKVRQRPFAILLFDEIEKAYPLVHDLLLQVLGEGRLTDVQGNLVDFTNTIIIMTSNIGAKESGRALGFDRNQASHVKQRYWTAIEQSFRPEWINRIDHIITFQPLSLEAAVNITYLLVDKLLQREGFKRNTTILSLHKDVAVFIAQKGFDPKLGGRALKRFIERELSMISANIMVRYQKSHAMIYHLTVENDSIQPHVQALYKQKLHNISTLKQFKDTQQLNQFLSEIQHVIKESIDLIVQQESSESLVIFSDDEEFTHNPFSSLQPLSSTQSDVPSSHSTHTDRNTMNLLLTKSRLLDLYEQLENYLETRLNQAKNIVLFSKTTANQIMKAWPYHSWRGVHIERDEVDKAHDLADYIREASLEPDTTSNYNLIYTLLTQVYFAMLQVNHVNQLQVQKVHTDSSTESSTDSDSITITLSSLVIDKGELEMMSLLCQYLTVLDELHVNYLVHWHTDMLHPCVHVQVFDVCVASWLASEEGIHLYTPYFNSPIPIQMKIETHGYTPRLTASIFSLSSSLNNDVSSNDISSDDIPSNPISSHIQSKSTMEIVRSYYYDAQHLASLDMLPKTTGNTQSYKQINEWLTIEWIKPKLKQSQIKFHDIKTDHVALSSSTSDLFYCQLMMVMHHLDLFNDLSEMLKQNQATQDEHGV